MEIRFIEFFLTLNKTALLFFLLLLMMYIIMRCFMLMMSVSTYF